MDGNDVEASRYTEPMASRPPSLSRSLWPEFDRASHAAPPGRVARHASSVMGSDPRHIHTSDSIGTSNAGWAAGELPEAAGDDATLRYTARESGRVVLPADAFGPAPGAAMAPGAAHDDDRIDDFHSLPQPRIVLMSTAPLTRGVATAASMAAAANRSHLYKCYRPRCGGVRFAVVDAAGMLCPSIGPLDCPLCQSSLHVLEPPAQVPLRRNLATRRGARARASEANQRAKPESAIATAAVVASNPECAICKEALRVGDRVREMGQCRHTFHPRCIVAWLDVANTCPMCRKPEC